MRSKLLKNLLRTLLYITGAGAGGTLAFLCVQVHDLTSEEPLSLWLLILLYGGMGALGMLAVHLTAPKLVSGWSDAMSALESRMESVTTAQLISMVIWLMGGLLIASLVTQILHFMGESIFSMSVSAILYVVLGVLGLTIGARRAEDMATLLTSSHPRSRRESTVKVLDASVLMDGRIAAVCRTGVVEGELLTADFILAEMREAAASPDAARRLRAQRGLETVKALPALRIEDTGETPIETDVALMALVREKNAALLTADGMMHKAARMAGVPVINVNDLALALRTVAAAGDVLCVQLTKPGKEPHQGVGFLPDGTMLVVENASALIGQTVEVTVTSVLQTSAGRMAFARLAA